MVTKQAQVSGSGRAMLMMGAEARSTVRDTAGLLIPIALPVLILVSNAVQPTATQVVNESGQRALDVYGVPLVITMVCALIAVVNMPSFLANYRRTGVLQTLSVTPISPVSVLVAQFVVSLLQLLLGVAVMLAVATFAFGLVPPEDLIGVVVAFTLGVLALYGLGMLVASLAPTSNSATAIGLVLFLGLGALGGMFGPNDAYPELLSTIGNYLPFGAMLTSMQAAWSGAPWQLDNLLALGITAVVGAVVAGLTFRWR